MKTELTAFSRQSAAGENRGDGRNCALYRLRSARCTRHSPLATHHSARSARGFTLVELLIVSALIALMAALIAPSLQGLFGVAGRRGGANLLAGALEQARLAAIENGVSAYLGFPAGMDTDESSASTFIVFRSAREDELATNSAKTYLPLSRWFKLPRGVFVDPETIKDAAPTSISLSGMLPKLGTKSVSTTYSIEFDRFGKIKGDPSALRRLRVGEGIFSGGSVTYRPSDKDYYKLTLYPMTGRVKIVDGLVEP